MKYYIKSGKLQDVVDAPDPLDGCIKAIKRNPNTTIGVAFEISERGFEKRPGDFYIQSFIVKSYFKTSEFLGE